MRHTGLAACLLCLGISACSADKPKAPTPVYPKVAGTCASTATFLITAGNVTCAANTPVSQAGRSVNLAAIQLSSECGGGTIPGGRLEPDRYVAVVKPPCSTPGAWKENAGPRLARVPVMRGLRSLKPAT